MNARYLVQLQFTSLCKCAGAKVKGRKFFRSLGIEQKGNNAHEPPWLCLSMDHKMEVHTGS